jgi:hypothetical protein
MNDNERSEFEKALTQFLDEEAEAPDVFILWTKPNTPGHQVVVRGDILGITGKLDYIIYAWRQNLFMNSMRQQQTSQIIVPKGGRMQ